jgi:hypothetical protein
MKTQPDDAFWAGTTELRKGVKPIQINEVPSSSVVEEITKMVLCYYPFKKELVLCSYPKINARHAKCTIAALLRAMGMPALTAADMMGCNKETMNLMTHQHGFLMKNVNIYRTIFTHLIKNLGIKTVNEN